MDASKSAPFPVRVAVEGCVRITAVFEMLDFRLLSTDRFQGHGCLNDIYASVESAAAYKGWDGVVLLIIGGDFQVSFELQHFPFPFY